MGTARRGRTRPPLRIISVPVPAPADIAERREAALDALAELLVELVLEAPPTATTLAVSFDVKPIPTAKAVPA